MTHSGQVSRNLPRHSVTALCVPQPKGRCNCNCALWTVNCDLLLSSLARFVNWSCQLRCHWAKSAAASSSCSSTARYQTIFIHKSQSHSVVNSLGTTAGLDLWGLSKKYKIFVNFLRKYLCTVLIFALSFPLRNIFGKNFKFSQDLCNGVRLLVFTGIHYDYNRVFRVIVYVPSSLIQCLASFDPR